jgi:CheY-like chemotaxis protein
MSFRESLGPELPYLRRYARAITGSQAMGDAAVREMLEALVEAPGEFDEARPPRLELYRIFHHLWRPDVFAELSPDAPTSALSMRSRQSLLLTAVEGFSVADTGTILGAPPEVVESDLAMARETIAAQLASDVMIIEDEAIIAMHIKAIVSEMGHKVVGIARTRDEAVAMARTGNPELVLADISLADGSSGIDAINDILAEMDMPVIFVTAFPERLLTGERPEPTYLITKPFEAATLSATIAQVLMFHRESDAARLDIPAYPIS